jgi:site-specific DNA recombinase
VADAHVYVDDGVSGGEFLNRPGFLRMMSALKPRAPFQAVVMAEPSRLGRHRQRTDYALYELVDAGVRVFFYLEDREALLDDATSSFMESVRLYAAQMERDKARQRTHDAMIRKAMAGQVAGGMVYGYNNVEVLSPAPGLDGQRRRQHVLRQINEGQAAVLCRIFELTAQGYGLVRIAKLLNAEAVPPPRRTGRLGPGWAPSAIREMLRRELYRGVVTWNRTRRIDRGGTRTKVDRPPSEWLTFAAPELRIIDEPLWTAVQARLEEKQATYVRSAGGRLWGRPERSLDSPYLLTGFARCAVCGGSFFVRRRTSRGHERTYYGCMYRHQRGPNACANSLTVAMDDANAAFLTTLREDVLSARVVRRTIARAIELAIEEAEAEEPGQRRLRLEEELRHVELEIARFTDAIGRGEPVASILEALRTRERRKREIREALHQVDGLALLATRTEDLDRELATKLAEWQGLLERQPIQSRQLLRKLLAGRVLYTPHQDEAGGFYEFAGQASWGKLLTGVVGQLRWCPRGDSNTRHAV